jgi:hypothetical protein
MAKKTSKNACHENEKAIRQFDLHIAHQVGKCLKKNVGHNLSKCFFLLLLFFTSCSSELEQQKKSQNSSHCQIEVSTEDKKWMSEFFTDFFLKGGAIYTLFGSKPMSQITIDTGSEKQWLESAAPYLHKEEEKRKKEIINQIKQHHQEYHLPQNWEKWTAWKKKYPHSCFLFAKRSVDENPYLFDVYIINAPEVAWTLQKHYSLFSRELKMEFDPIEVTLEFEDPNSVFWGKILSNHLLQGILLGYGERNAYFFSRRVAQRDKHEKDFNACMSDSSSSDKNRREGDTIETLQLPLFRSYEPAYGEDPVVVKYEKERQMIQQLLKNKDFVEEALNRLFKCMPQEIQKSEYASLRDHSLNERSTK